MFDEDILFLDKWQQLSQPAQKSIFEQVIRYFIHPLWTVNAIQPLATNCGRTYQAVLNGQSFFLMPGRNDDQYQVGPFLMAKQATAANLKVVGQLDAVTGRTLGNQLLLNRYRSEIQSYLNRSVVSLNPFNEAEPFVTEHLLFDAVGIDNQVIQIFQRKSWGYQDLRHDIQSFGGDLPTKNQWESAATLFLTEKGAEVVHHHKVTTFGLGMDFKVSHDFELLSDSLIQKVNPCWPQEPSSHQALMTKLQSTVTQVYPSVLTNQFAYRSVLSVHLD